MPPALKWPQRRATIGRAALCVRAALGVWLGGGRAAAPAANLGGLVRAFARPPAFLALARCALCSLAVCAFAQGAPARRACVLPPVAAVVRGLRVGRARAVASCFGVFLRWRLWGGGLALASCFRPACAVAVRLAAVSPSAGVVRVVLWRGAGWGGFRARWPSLRRRPGRLGRWPRSVLRPLGGLSSGFPPLFRARGAPPGAVVGGCSGVWSGVGSAGAFLAAAPAVFFSPLTTPLFSPWRWRAAMRSISVRGAKNSCAPVRPLAGRLSCGRGPRLGCVRGRRAWAVVLPPLACALRLPRRVLLPRPSARVAPVVWLAGRGGEGCCILQRPRMETSTRLPALRSPPLAAIQPKPRGKAKGGRFHPRLYTKFCVQKIPGQKNTGRGRRGTAPARKTGGNDAQNPLKCHQKAPALTRGGQKEGFPVPKRPADRPKMGCQMSSRCLSVR